MNVIPRTRIVTVPKTVTEGVTISLDAEEARALARLVNANSNARVGELRYDNPSLYKLADSLKELL